MLSMFLAFIPLAVLGLALCVARSASPVVSLLALIGIFLCSIVLLIAVRAEFLGYLFLIIYVGAIAILFLFVIMMFNLKKLALQSLSLTEGQEAVLWITTPFLLKLYYFLDARFEQLPSQTTDVLESYVETLQQSYQDIFLFSEALYIEHFFLFLVLGLLLLTAMIGSIVLALSTVEIPNQKNWQGA